MGFLRKEKKNVLLKIAFSRKNLQQKSFSKTLHYLH